MTVFSRRPTRSLSLRAKILILLRSRILQALAWKTTILSVALLQLSSRALTETIIAEKTKPTDQQPAPLILPVLLADTMPPAVTSSSPDEDAETHFIHSPELEIRRTETPGKSLEKLLRGICNPNHDNFFSDSDNEEELEDQNYDVLLESASRQSSPQQQLPPQLLSNNTVSSTKSSNDTTEDFFQQLLDINSKFSSYKRNFLGSLTSLTLVWQRCGHIEPIV